MKLNRLLYLLAGLVGAAAVGLGAFAAHGLEAKLAAEGLEAGVIAKRLHTCEIATRYHAIHAVALLALASAPFGFANRRRVVASALITVGLILFSGVLYAQAIAGLKGFNLVVPIGGLSFILGWLTISTLALGKPQVSPPLK